MSSIAEKLLSQTVPSVPAPEPVQIPPPISLINPEPKDVIPPTPTIADPPAKVDPPVKIDSPPKEKNSLSDLVIGAAIGALVWKYLKGNMSKTD